MKKTGKIETETRKGSYCNNDVIISHYPESGNGMKGGCPGSLLSHDVLSYGKYAPKPDTIGDGKTMGGIIRRLGDDMRLPRSLTLSLLILTWILSLAAVPPHPLKTDVSGYRQPHPIPLRELQDHHRDRILPQRVLSIMVDFPDQQFVDTPGYPDSLVHDSVYFERYMFHLNAWCHDASHGQYEFDYDVFDRISLSQNMTFYGDDDEYGNLITMVEEIFTLLDPQIDLSQYDAFTVFHAGPGQESDIYGNHPGQIWSTFVNKYDLKEELDPENENFQGLATDDGVWIAEVAILPEWQWQPEFTEDDPKLGMLGVLAHEFGHQLDLPTLYDNVSSNGRSAGIGNWGVMGTGAWNADGYVPPMPCAWSRCFMGWEVPLEITMDFANIELTQMLDSLATVPVVCKIPVTEQEYFLIENRMQNPDGSTSQATGAPSFTFQLLDEGQEYYPPGHPNAGDPKFDFMTNTFEGCEWDFYLPGLGGPDNPVIDGSGLLIWHVDESVIDEKFTLDFETNQVNGDADHKGVDLEEADGLQHMDSNLPDLHMRGSPDDSYREGNNTYFGFEYDPTTGGVSQPTSESYYGGYTVEVYDIGPAGNTMNFSVRFSWSLNAGYGGENLISGASLDLDGDGIEEIFYPQPNGMLRYWRDDQPVEDEFPVTLALQGTIDVEWAFDPASRTLLLPAHSGGGDAFLTIQQAGNQSYVLYPDYTWATHPVVNPDPSSPIRSILFLQGETYVQLVLLDSDFQEIASYNLGGMLGGNPVLKDNTLFYSTIHPSTTYWRLGAMTLGDQNITYRNLPLTETDSIAFLAMADLDADNRDDLVVLTPDSKLYAVSIPENGADTVTFPGYPLFLGVTPLAPPTIADVDGNGKLDIILGAENRWYVAGYSGEILNAPVTSISEPDTTGTAAPLLCLDVDNDGENEYLGSMSRGRLFCWDTPQNIHPGFPVTYATRSRHAPWLTIGQQGVVTAYLFSDVGTIFRQFFTDCDPEVLSEPHWQCAYSDLMRTAAWQGAQPSNQFQTSSIFVPDQVYLFPNPLNKIYGMAPTLNMMTSRDTEVHVKVFDIAGNLIFDEQVTCQAYMANRDKLRLDTTELASGVYFALIEAAGEVERIRFAIEK